MPQAPCGVSSARHLVSHALLRWRQRMLRADNTSAIVIALQEPGTSQDTLHHEEVLLDLTKVSQCPPTSISRANTPILQVRADANNTYCFVVMFGKYMVFLVSVALKCSFVSL